MKIVIDEAIPFIKGRIPEEVETIYVPCQQIVAETVKDADALIVRTRTKCNQSLLEGSKVKLIATATIGTDHIDIPWCEANNIKVTSAPGCNAPGVAQYVLASLFYLGFNPDKDTLGVIGYGNVGSIVTEWAGQLGIKVLINDLPRSEAGLKDVDYLPLEEVLTKSDAVTLHVPLNKTGDHPTFHLLSEKELDVMKKAAILVNSSRGGIVDEKVLKKFLNEQRLRAIVDVWDNEPNIDRELAGLCSIATPHIAGYSAEGKKRATKMVLEALKESFGLEINFSGLECVPNGSFKMTRELIENSYNPYLDHKNFMHNMSNFEKLRNEYDYRHEPLFSFPNLS